MALFLASGIIFSSMLGGLHPLGSGHHSMGSHEPTGHGLVAMHVGDATEGPAEHHSPGSTHTPDERAPEECPCLGGVCVVSIQAPAAEKDGSAALDLDAPTEASLVPVFAVLGAGSEHRLQPPGRAPPTAV